MTYGVQCFIENWDCDPSIVGPFETKIQAERFRLQTLEWAAQNWPDNPNLEGVHATIVLANPDTVDCSPNDIDLTPMETAAEPIDISQMK